MIIYNIDMKSMKLGIEIERVKSLITFWYCSGLALTNLLSASTVLFFKCRLLTSFHPYGVMLWGAFPWRAPSQTKASSCKVA